jgi:tetratricopeptide (TPR) repeat protein
MRRRTAMVRRSGGYVLEVSAELVDMHRFRRLIATAREADRLDGDRVGLLVEALGLWRGTPLADIPGSWAARMREGLMGQRLDAGVVLAETRLRLGDHLSLIGLVRELLVEYPLAEPLYAVLMRALLAAGRQAEALDCYATLRAALREALGTEPSAELRRLHQAVLRGDPPPPVATGTPAPAGAGLAPRQPVSTPTPGQLPPEVRGFAGRGAQLRWLDALCRDGGRAPTVAVISAVSGGGGVGKTALAIHWAHRVRSRFPDGQLYVNLRGFDPTRTPMSSGEAVRYFLDALGVPPQRVPSAVEAQVGLYRSLLADRQVLVLLDNARDAEQVRPLLPGSAGCLAVVTSRDDLRSLIAVDGAQSLTLDVLPAAEATQMLAQRLGAGHDDQEPAAVDEIIHRCARLPLALAIAAARVATSPTAPLAALAKELHDADASLDILNGGDASSDVRTVFSWSYKRLTAAAARLFRLLGLQPGPDIATPAAASLAALPVARVRRLLGELARAHLVTEHVPGRYAFHDLLRAYAADLAHTTDPDEQHHAAIHRLFDHYLHTAHAAARLLYPAGHPVAPAPPQPGVTPEHPADHEQALAWFSVDHAVLLAVVDHAHTTGFDTHTWQLAWTLSTFLARRGYWHDQAAIGRVALTAAQRLGDPTAQALAHRTLARAYSQLGRLDDAHTHLNRALDLTAQAGDQVGQAYVHNTLAYLWRRRGCYWESLDHSRQALDLFRAADHRVGQAMALNAVGWYHALLGDHEQALAYCQQALTLFQELGDREGQAGTWDSLGYAHHHLGHHTQAITCYQHALTLCRAIGNLYTESESLTHLGDTHHSTGNHQAARDAWQHALTILTDLDHPDADTVRAKLRHLDHPDYRYT